MGSYLHSDFLPLARIRADAVVPCDASMGCDAGPVPETPRHCEPAGVLRAFCDASATPTPCFGEGSG